MDKHITVREVAALTGTSESYWRKLAGRREIRTFRLGRAMRFLEDDVRKFVLERERPARAGSR
jgi:excisionase family DNA binding protein